MRAGQGAHAAPSPTSTARWPGPPHLALGTVVILGAVVVLELGYGAQPGAVARYLGYEIGFVVVPGWLVYRAVSDRPGPPLRQLAIGWALGYVLEIIAFLLTAATGTRRLLLVYPVAVSVLAVAALRRRRRRRARPVRRCASDAAPPPRFVWALVAVCVMVVGYVGIAFFDAKPLPEEGNVHLGQDAPWAISIAAEAKHHWPIQDPSVSGEPLPYHYFVQLHWAAASEVTGLDLATVFYRLWMLPLAVLLVLEMVVAGQSLLRSRQAGLIAACVVVGVGQLQVDTSEVSLGLAPVEIIPFRGLLFTFLIGSPSFLLGLVLFVPLVVLVGERIVAPAGERHRGEWALVTLFVVGASDAKVVLLPLVATALVLFAAWSWWTSRRVARAVWVALGLAASAFGALYLVQYRGHSSGLSVDLSAGVDYFTGMPMVALLREELLEVLPTVPGRTGVLAVAAFTFGVVGLLAAQLIGLVWLLRRQGFSLDPAQAWLLALFGAGLIPIMTVTSLQGNEQYFLFTALVAGCLVSGQGLWRAWESRPPLAGRAARLVAVGTAAGLAILLLLLAPARLDLLQGRDEQPLRYLVLFGGLAVCMVVLYAVAGRWVGPTRWPAAALVCVAIVALGAIDTPLRRLGPAFEPDPPVEEGRRMTPALYHALTWIRDHSSTDAVLAVNNQRNEFGPYAFVYGAFAERRVFLGGWGYSDRASLRTSGDLEEVDENPFPDRLALNETAFQSPTAGVLEVLHDRHGVEYLVADLVNGGAVDRAALGALAPLVYEDDGVAVYEIAAPA
jgi:hypothetical protein